MSHKFVASRQFHAGHSLLGRWIHKRISDPHFAEGLFILIFSALAIGLVLTNYLGWALFNPYFYNENGALNEFLYWLFQCSLAVVFLICCVAGYKPALNVSFDARHGLTASQGEDSLHLPVNAIQSVSTISALRFHRHYRKYRATRAFFGKMPSSLLLISTTNGPVILGLEEADQQELQGLLQPQTEKIVFPTLSPTV